MTAVEVCEVKPPRGVKPLRWVLYTRDAVLDAQAARRVAQDYARRPTIEDYHKGIKTGCQLEERQYGTAARLERIAAVLSVVAVRLLQIRAIARVEPERAAQEIAPQEWVSTLYHYTASKSPKYAQRGRPPTGPFSSSCDAWPASADSSDAKEMAFPVGSPSGEASPSSCS